MNSAEERLRQNLAEVRERMAESAAKSGRSADAITLIGVTKYVSSDVARQLFQAGVCDLAESRPQVFWQKEADLAELAVRWHFIGHLQRNKLRRTLPVVDLLHSADSLRLLEEIEAFGCETKRTADVLLEINTSGDAAKHGFSAEELPVTLARIADFSHVRVHGLMTMAALEGGIAVARRNFAALRELRDRVQSSAPTNVQLEQLSMGMSDDYQVAIEEGATMIRVGSALFAGV